MKLEPTNHKTPNDEMTFGDFIIRYEHKFLRNINTIKQIEESDHMKNLESYYEIFKDYIMICIGLLALLNNFNRHDFINLATEEFVEERFAGNEIQDIKNTSNQTEIKNALSATHGNVPKFNLKFMLMSMTIYCLFQEAKSITKQLILIIFFHMFID